MSKGNFKEYIIAPGEAIKEFLETNSMTQLDLASKIGMSKKQVNEIINGKAPITPSTAQKLEYVFDVPASFWNNFEKNYREALERQKDEESVKSDEKYLSKIPYAEMAKRNWYYIEKTRNPSEKVKNLRKFFSVASLSFDTELKKKLAFRKSNNKNFSYESLYCWIRYGEIKSNKEEYQEFNIDKLKENSHKIRNLAKDSFMKEFDNIKDLLKECGVALVVEPALPNTYVNGASYKITTDKALIMLSNKGKKDDILWFTLFHEIAHLIKHSKKEVFVDSENSETNSIEKEADDYAKNILIPQDEYDNFVGKCQPLSENKIISFSNKININPGIVVGRMQNDKIIGWNEFNNLIVRI